MVISIELRGDFSVRPASLLQWQDPIADHVTRFKLRKLTDRAANLLAALEPACPADRYRHALAAAEHFDHDLLNQRTKDRLPLDSRNRRSPPQRGDVVR